jgi:tetratricopeptide (TPR) repeat protein
MSHEIGIILTKKGQYKKAISIFEQLIEKKNNDLRANFLLGRVYYEINDLKKSLFFYKKCNQIQPATSSVLFNLALVLQGLGKIGESKKTYLKLISINPKDIKSYYGLFILDIKNIDHIFYKKLEILVNESSISLFEKSLINFMFSKLEKKKSNFKDEINYLMLSHQQCYKSNTEYNNQSNFYYKNIIFHYFNKIKFQGNFKKINLNKAKAIFIIGLPRSGSTLIETLISHNSQNIDTVGEFHAINRSVLDQIGPVIYSKNFDHKNFEFILDQNKFQISLLEKYENLKSDSFIDKSLENFFNIEIILKFFPDAKFLHTYRDFNDAVLGIHQKMLPELSWSHDLKSIIQYVKNYKKIIDYFKKKYPSQILDVELDKLTNEQETEAKKILEFCNIKFKKDYLDFYKNKTLFNKTNSFLQVREKIQKYKTNKYQPYYYLLDKFKVS